MGIMSKFFLWGDGVVGEKMTLQDLYNLYMSGDYDANMAALAIIYRNGEPFLVVDVSPNTDIDSSWSELNVFVDDIVKTALLQSSLAIRMMFSLNLDGEIIINDFFDGLGFYADGWTVDAYIYRQ